MRIYKYYQIIEESATEICLKNCAVVIDGQNYFHNIYENQGIPFMFGCETDKYAKHLKEDIERFNEANVTCYIVFKGGDSDIMKRLQKFRRLHFDVNAKCEFIPPVLMKDATIQVIREMDVKYAFCVAEAKDDCVALAQKLNCPIISNDIEFSFRKPPYIPSTTIKFDSKNKSFRCRQHKLQDFLQKHSLTEVKIAIFATLTDTIVFPLNFFDSLLKKWRVTNENNYKQLKYLIKWLSKHTEQELRDEISRSLHGQNQEKFWLNYQKVLTNMRKVEGGYVTEYLLNSNIPIARQDPEWFEKGVVCKHVPPIYINLYKSKVIEGNWVILDKDSENISLPLDIIKYAYNLLTNYRGDIIRVYQDTNSYAEVNTRDSNIRRPRYECQVSVFENGWEDLKNLKLFEHFLSQNGLDIDALHELPAERVVLFISLVYFARKKRLEGKDVTREVFAVLLTFFVLDSENFLEIDGTYVCKYYKCGNIKRIFDGKALNTFVELQYCIQHMNYLNTLCGSPYDCTEYSTAYNGTFVFNLFCDMKDKQINNFIEEIFHDNPILLTTALVLIQDFRKLLK